MYNLVTYLVNFYRNDEERLSNFHMYDSLQDQSEMRSDSIESRNLTVFQKFQNILSLNKIYPPKGEFANILT